MKSLFTIIMYLVIIVSCGFIHYNSFIYYYAQDGVILDACLMQILVLIVEFFVIFPLLLFIDPVNLIKVFKSFDKNNT